MAEHLELWTEKTPEPVSDRTPVPLEVRPNDEAATTPGRRGRERGPFVTYLFLPWSYGDGDRQPGETWHRMKCRLRRHQMTGGQMVQVGGEVVFLERTCRWCGTEARSG